MATKEYALYRGEDLLDFGTKQELAKKFNVKPETIGFYSTKSYVENRFNKHPESRLICVVIPDDDDTYEDLVLQAELPDPDPDPELQDEPMGTLTVWGFDLAGQWDSTIRCTANEVNGILSGMTYDDYDFDLD